MPQFHWPDLPPKPHHRSKGLAEWQQLRAEREAAWCRWVAEQRERVARQRALFAANLGPARAALQADMLSRAWAPLEDNECEAADALLEYLPETAAAELLNEFFAEAMGDG
jgi:hypothetical protein